MGWTQWELLGGSPSNATSVKRWVRPAYSGYHFLWNEQKSVAHNIWELDLWFFSWFANSSRWSTLISPRYPSYKPKKPTRCKSHPQMHALRDREMTAETSAQIALRQNVFSDLFF
jgi:hypothetical protein